MGRVLIHSLISSVLFLNCVSAKASRASDSGLDILQVRRTKSLGVAMIRIWYTLLVKWHVYHDMIGCYPLQRV